MDIFGLDFSKLVNNQEKSDVHFIMKDGGTVFGHKFVLQDHSPHLRDVFQSKAHESPEGVTFIHTDVSRPALLAILGYLYCGNTDIDLRVAAEVMQVAEHWKLEGLRKKCAEGIKNQVTLDNVVELFMNADHHRTRGLKQACLELITTNFSSVSQTEGFSKLAQKPTLLLEISQALGGSIIHPRFEIGKRFTVFEGVAGTIRYVGRTSFDGGKGYWLGLETDLPVGKHDGMVNSRRYFTAKPNHGLFVGFWFV